MTTPQAAPTGATYREVFAVRQFRVLFTGYTLFLGGETVKLLALSVTVYAGTGSSLLAALAYVAGFLPFALGGTLLLAYADRWPPRAVLAGYDLVRAVVAAVLAAGVLSPAAMLVLVFVTGVPGAIASAARGALLPELLDGDRYVLGRAVFSMAAGGTQVLGFAAGGMLIAAIGPYGALWITVASCLLSAALLRLRLAGGPGRGTTAGTYAVRQTWRVNRELLRRPEVRSLLLAQWLPPALVVGAEGVLVPYAVRIGVPGSAGLLFTAVALGMLAGDLVIGRLAGPERRERLARPLALLLGAPLLGFVPSPGPGVAAVLLAVSGFGVAYQLGLARRFLEAVPTESRGQAFGLALTGTTTLQGLSAAGGGALGEVVAPGLVVGAAGAASLLAVRALWRVLAPPPR
ncbi:MFS transporter [Nonomuraea gerenzanensis]|uniref:Major facilitator superfamily MFS_1 n=1 Tax=Nonomuraea gerenzanensis TaxID=93944 RepID=A0A1M4EAA5_9ACTN|nr:MFS transporter [Nonomuraea gerenzanensis]UBU17858.1 MFS transporter [Nonomuraea gerenzanensis]SBO95648.1 major facilitator superfamily MFS_1 [Nonomuraea gerenzanensis]